MNYVEGSTPKDIWFVISKFLPLETLLLLKSTQNTLFNKDSIVHKEYYHQWIDDGTRNDYLSQMEKVYKDVQTMSDIDLLEYSCCYGYIQLLKDVLKRDVLKQSKTIIVKKIMPMKRYPTPIITATEYGHLKIVKYLTENYEEECLSLSIRCLVKAKEKHRITGEQRYQDIVNYLYHYVTLKAKISNNESFLRSFMALKDF